MAELVAFTAEHISRITGLSLRQLHYWDDTGFFSPTVIDEFRTRAFGRFYTFRDAVGLRTISILRKKHRVPLQELRRVGGWLQQHYETPWSSLRFKLAGRKVVFVDPQTGVPTEPRGHGQQLLSVSLQAIASETEKAAADLVRRPKSQIGRVEKKRYVVQNAPVLAGTRIRTDAIWHFHQAGYNTKAIIAEYPRLRPKDVAAAIKYEADRRQLAA